MCASVCTGSLIVIIIVTIKDLKVAVISTSSPPIHLFGVSRKQMELEEYQ